MEQHAIKLVSLNIEMDRHVDRVIPFLLKENPDVVCLQEVLERDVPTLAEALHMRGDFVPVSIVDVRYEDGTLIVDTELAKKGPQGIGFFTSLPIRGEGVEYYHGNPKEITRHSAGYSRFLLWRRVEKEGVTFTIGTTHFTWTPDGEASDEQRRDAEGLLQILKQFPDIIFCGDFNAPRGGEIWEMFASRYRDTIPARFVTSIDQNLHRVKGLTRMVDGLFSTPEYRCAETRLECGVSDHCAVVSTITRV